MDCTLRVLLSGHLQAQLELEKKFQFPLMFLIGKEAELN